MISEKVKEVIKSRAEKKYPPTFFTGAVHLDDSLMPLKREVYISGQEEMFEDMIEFIDWMRKEVDAAVYTNGEKVWWHEKNLTSYTTTELYELYVKQKG